jgi:hypothetical protein
MGLFGSFFGSAPAPMPAPSANGAPPILQGYIPWSDRLMAAGAALGGDSATASGIRQRAYERSISQQQIAYQRQMLASLMPSAPTYADGPAPQVSTQGMFGSQAPEQGASASAQPSAAPTPDVGDLSGNLSRMAPTAAPGPSAATAQPWAYQPPQRTSNGSPGISLSDPNLASKVAMYKAMGIDLAPSLEALKAQQPDIAIGSDGTPYDKKAPASLAMHFSNLSAVGDQIKDLNDKSNTNRALAKMPVPGANPVYDNQGNIVDWTLPSGAARAIGATEAAKTGAQEAAKLPYVGPSAYAQSSGTEAGKLPYAGPIAQAAAAGTGAGGAPYKLQTHDINGVPTTMTDAQAIVAAGGGAAPSSPTLSVGGAASALAAIAPGARITSLGRTPAHNAAVGGVPDSMHVADSALDFVPPKGMSLNAFHQKLVDAGLPATELINEGDHFHWGWAPKGQSTPAAAASAPGFHGTNANDQKTVQGYLDTAKSLEDLSSLGQRFSKLNTQQASGPGFRPFEVPVPFAHGGEVDLNAPGALAKQYQSGVPAMQNLTNQLALAQRSSGMRITQMEFQKFLGSAPSVENLPKQNDKIIQGYQELAGQRRAYANFASNWLAEHGSLNGMDQAYAAGGSKPSSAPAQKIRTYNPKTGGLE